jgi:hypothetical protein
VIPTAFVAGLVIGRWWGVPLVAAAWTALVAATTDCDLACALGAAALAAANAGVGVLLRYAARWALGARRPSHG